MFLNRQEAGLRLAQKLGSYAHGGRVVVLALPRGGVPVGFEIASALGAPLDVFVVRKLGVPGHEELAFGAIASGGVRVLNEQLLSELPVPDYVIDGITAEESSELARRERAYRGDRACLEVRGSTVILVDDGVATGSTMRAAIRALRLHEPTRVVVAVPLGPLSACDEIELEADELVCLAKPEPFFAVGQWYADFTQTSDDQVRELLEQAAKRPLCEAA